MQLVTHISICLFCQGLLFAQSEAAKTPVDLVRMWMHEAERVYRDKLTDEKDMEQYDKLNKDIIKKQFEVRPKAKKYVLWSAGRP